MKHAGVRIAARIVTMLWKTAIALFSGLHETVSADRRLEELRGLVLEAVVHSVVEGEVELVDAAGTPVSWSHRRAGRRHDAAVVGAGAVLGVVFHPEVVAHLVGYCRGHDSNNLVVVHRDTARELVSADRPLQRLSHHAAVENFAGQQLCIVVWVVLHEILLAVVQEASQRLVAVGREISEILLRPDDNAQQCDKYV